MVKAQVSLSPIKDENCKEVIRDADMLWDSGAHYTIITEDFLCERSRRQLHSKENKLYHI